MFNKNSDFLINYTVSSVQFIYRLFVQNTFFILSNALFLCVLFFIRLSINNFVFFIIPIFFFLVSFSGQFKVIQESEETISLRKYFLLYKEILRNSWATFLFYTFFIVFIVVDLRILFLAKLPVMMYPFLITSCFLLSSMFFNLLISSDVRAKKLSFKRKILWSIRISYRLPRVAVVNGIYLFISLFCLQNFSLAYLCFFGGAINYFLFKNLTRSFSVSLFYKQILGEDTSSEETKSLKNSSKDMSH
ncbi:hypothetical protein ACYSNW_10300 [Enterococcus sp. LJL99]